MDILSQNQINERLFAPSSRYFNINQYRTDVWQSLKANVILYAKRKNDPQEEAELRLQILNIFEILETIESYWAFPGAEVLAEMQRAFSRGEFRVLLSELGEVIRSLTTQSFRNNIFQDEKAVTSNREKKKQHYFEILIADSLTMSEQEDLKKHLESLQSPDEKFVYKVVYARSFQDALIALLFNPYIQSCVIRYGVGFHSENKLKHIRPFIARTDRYARYEKLSEKDLGMKLANLLRKFRPEVDLFYITDTSPDKLRSEDLLLFRRIFYRQEDGQELNLSILKGIQDRYETPFFDALVKYSKRPTGVFHAMPISRGNSVFNSNWIGDLGDFYGRNLFMAETSATTGGLDSLLQPTGPLKKAQEYAAMAFGSKQTFFATNGTSTANKIVVQALIKPGDIVLIDRDCHKSHHYGMVLAGAHVVYLDSYPIENFTMYGGIPPEEIKHRLLELKAAGMLDRVKLLLLTNSTFDGIVYNVEKIMEMVLSIKPDMIFIWDEAWFAFAGFSYTFRIRTAMFNAERLAKKYRTAKFREIYNMHLRNLPEGESPSLPDPDKVRIRVYATQSTHKTLTSLRQGSMIHVFDEDFKRKVEDAFHEAYMTHTSTSPNYQILASLDVGRRQAELEGYELVEKSVEMAMLLREKVTNDPLISKYFSIVTIQELIPEQYRPSGIMQYYDSEHGWANMDEAWQNDFFVLDPTKITLFIGKTGIDGDTFKREFLMNEFGIQINKTTRNTVLFMTNIGTTRSSVAYLVNVLLKIALKLEAKEAELSKPETVILERKKQSLTKELPPLPNFSYFHEDFRPNPNVPQGDIRKAYFLAYDEENCEYMRLEDCEKAMKNGRELVSTGFVTPYPPGFPVLVPGQVITNEILTFMKELDVKEIHSYRPELGFRIFKEEVLSKKVKKTNFILHENGSLTNEEDKVKQ
jgi:arginine decarboxylase